MTQQEYGELCAMTGQASIGAGFDKIPAPIAPVKPIVLTLPYPVSTNVYWRTFMRPGMKAPVTCPSDEAKKYKSEVKARCYAAGIRSPIKGRIEFEYWLYPHTPKDKDKRIAKTVGYWDDTVKCQDLDNTIKVALDSLKNIAFEDDAKVFRIVGERMEPDGKPERLVVRISQWEP